jgi:hypothetical protein
MFRGRVQEYWLPSPFVCFPFTPSVRHRVPSRFKRAIETFAFVLSYVLKCPTYKRGSLVAIPIKFSMKGTLQQVKPFKLQSLLLTAETATNDGEWQMKLEHCDQILCNFGRGYPVVF